MFSYQSVIYVGSFGSKGLITRGGNKLLYYLSWYWATIITERALGAGVKLNDFFWKEIGLQNVRKAQEEEDATDWPIVFIINS